MARSVRIAGAIGARSCWRFGFFCRLGFLGFASSAGVDAVQTGALISAAWNAWVLGLAIGGIAIWAIVQSAEWHDWANGILGVWLLVAPWILGFSAMASATWSHVIVGLLVIVLAAWELWEVRHRATA